MRTVIIFLLSFSFILLTNMAGAASPANTIVVYEKSGSAQTNRPVSVARAFRLGDIPNCAQAVIGGAGVLTQCDVKNRWPDGSLKFAIVSFVAPSLSANGSVQVTFQNQASCNNTGYLTQSDMLTAKYDFDVKATLAGAVTRTSSARTMLGAGAWRYWLQGPIVTAVIIEDRSATQAYDVDFGDGSKVLHPLFEAWFYPQNNKVEVGATIENTWISTTASKSAHDLAYTYSLTSGSAAPVAEAVNWAGQTSETLTHTGWSRTHKTFWVGATDPGAIIVDQNLAYLASTRLIENFDPSLTLNATFVTKQTAEWTNATKTIQGSSPLTRSGFVGNWDKVQEGGGGHPWIGLHNTWDIVYLYQMTNQTLLDKVLGNADLYGRNQFHMRERDTPAGRGLYYDAAYTISQTSPLGRPLSIGARKEITTQDFSDTCSGSIGADDVNSGPITFEWSSYSGRTAPHHFPSVGYLPYLLTGKYYYMEEAQMESAYLLAWPQGCLNTQGGSSRQGNAGYITLTQNNEVRGAAWNFRSLVYAAAASPDGTPEKAYFDWYVRQNIALWEGTVGVANTDPNHATAYNWGVTKMQFADGGSPLGEFTRYLDNTDPVRTDGTPPRAATGCGDGSNCTNAPWMENFLLSALGMARDLGWPTDHLLQFRAKYNFGLAGGTPGIAYFYNDAYRMPGKVELSYIGGTGQGWAPSWTAMGAQYVLAKTAWSTGSGSDQQYQYIALGALSFLGPYTALGIDGVTAYNNVRTSLNGAVNLANKFSGAVLTDGSDSPKWNILPRSGSVPSSTLPFAPSNLITE
jgi:hypothetical protein